MLLQVRKYVLCLNLVARIGHASEDTRPVPVIGLTTGIDQVTGSLPVRMNINILEEEGGPMWDLFIRGLDALQHKPEDDERSHFALAGIHGMPYAPYNDVESVPGGSGGGYCPHQSPQLISWHRAYLVLYEQILGDEVQRLALEYINNDDATAYREASEKLRLPYWDWASDSKLPASTTRENITVNGPNGTIVLHNPLYNYQWQTYPLDPTQFPGQSGMGPVTTRDEGDDVTSSIKDSVYRTFSSAVTYDQMASMAGSGPSFESPHNTIHNFVGGSFLSLDLTSFDALFLLHHCNLDRLAAMWTASHHDTLQAEPFTSQGLYSTAKGEIVTADSPLKPFYQADGIDFHTGRTMAATEAFGYTYLDIPSEDQGRKEGVIVQINRLYGDLAPTWKPTNTSTSRREWVAEIQVDRADLELPCNINVYIGDHLAGRTMLLNMPKTGLAHDELPLSRAIDILDVDRNKPKAIERKLVSDLYVSVTKDGSMLNPRDIPSLRVTLVGEDVTPPSGESELPSYSNRTIVKTILAGSLNAWPRSTYSGTTDAIIGHRWTA